MSEFEKIFPKPKHEFEIVESMPCLKQFKEYAITNVGQWKLIKKGYLAAFQYLLIEHGTSMNDFLLNIVENEISELEGKYK